MRTTREARLRCTLFARGLIQILIGFKMYSHAYTVCKIPKQTLFSIFEYIKNFSKWLLFILNEVLRSISKWYVQIKSNEDISKYGDCMFRHRILSGYPIRYASRRNNMPTICTKIYLFDCKRKKQDIQEEFNIKRAD